MLDTKHWLIVVLGYSNIGKKVNSACEPSGNIGKSVIPLVKINYLEL